MLPRSLPLSTRILLLLLAGVGLFGSANYYIFGRLAYTSLEREFEERGRSLSRLAASMGLAPVLQGDPLALASLAEDFQKDNPDVLYLVFYGPGGTPLGGTFGSATPDFLRDPPSPGQSVQRFRSREGRFMDFSVPLAGGSTGWVRLGLSERFIRARVRLGQALIVAMILAFLAFGSAGAFLLTRDIRRGAHELVAGAEAFSFDQPTPGLPTGRSDEIGEVARHLKAMMERTQALHREHLTLLSKFEKADRLTIMGLLASGLAHEINNPLGGLIASLQRLAKNPADTEKVEAYAGPMLDAAEHIRDVLANMMRFIRQQRTEPCAVPLGEVGRKLQLLAEPRMTATIQLAMEIPASLPPVYFDPSCLLQVLTNLVFNAMDAVEERGGTVTVRGWEEDGFVRLEVADDGVGMPPEILSKAFEPLFSTKPPGKGTGLGLPLSRQMVKDHGGILSLESTPGQGTRAVLLLKKAGP